MVAAFDRERIIGGMRVLQAIRQESKLYTKREKDFYKREPWFP
jgi:hypothetical protein